MDARRSPFFVALLLAAAGISGIAIAQSDEVQTDNRQLVEMPAQAQELLRQEMRAHLIAVNQVLGHLANNDLSAAAETAEQRLGESSMGKHRGTGMGPGRFMPSEMRQIGHGMHEAASRFAEIADSGDRAESYVAFQSVVASCVACHSSYRIR